MNKTYLNTLAGLVSVVLMSSCSVSTDSSSDKKNWRNDLQIGGFDSVHLYTPPPTPDKSNSLLIMLHGCVQKNTDLQGTNIEASAKKHHFVVAIPQSKHPAGFDCWAYWKNPGSRNNKHPNDYQNLISLAEQLVAQENLNIDADNVVIAGLSSGATFAGQAACLAPDIFSSVVMMAGPSIGTSAAGALQACEKVSINEFASRCKKNADDNIRYLARQRALIVRGEEDPTVHACYNEQNARGFAHTYGIDSDDISSHSEIEITTGIKIAESTWANNRVRMVSLEGVDHSWPGGTNADGNYVSSNSISLVEYLMSYMKKNTEQ